MSRVLKKNWLIISFSIALFSLISIAIAKADLVVTVLDSSCSPLDSDVIVKCGETTVCDGATGVDGIITCPVPPESCSCPGSVDVYIYYPPGTLKYDA